MNDDTQIGAAEEAEEANTTPDKKGNKFKNKVVNKVKNLLPTPFVKDKKNKPKDEDSQGIGYFLSCPCVCESFWIYLTQFVAILLGLNLLANLVIGIVSWIFLQSKHDLIDAETVDYRGLPITLLVCCSVSLAATSIPYVATSKYSLYLEESADDETEMTEATATLEWLGRAKKVTIFIIVTNLSKLLNTNTSVCHYPNFALFF